VPHAKKLDLPLDLAEQARSADVTVVRAPVRIASAFRADGTGAQLILSSRNMYVLGDLDPCHRLFHVRRLLHYLQVIRGKPVTAAMLDDPGRSVKSPQRGRDQGDWTAFEQETGYAV